MKNIQLAALFIVLAMTSSCKSEKKASPVDTPAIDNSLTAEEKAAGVMTPEIMWKFRRLGSFALSPDGKSVIYTLTDIDLATEKRVTNIYRQNLPSG
nr:peptidase S9 [Bacteroidales bacterium]